jgi:hypothetical protein
MDKHEQAVHRGEEAQRLLNSEMLQQAFADTRKAITEAWAGLPTSDAENAKDLHRMVKLLDRVQHCIREHVNTGKIAQKQIQSVAKPPFLQRWK